MRAPRKWDWTAILLISPSVAIFLGLLVMPILVVLVLSFGERAEAGGYQAAFTFAQYANLPARWAAFRNTLTLAPLGTIICLLAAYPLAYYLAFVARRRRYTLLLLILAPFFTSYLLRVIAWKVILSNNGVINSVLWQLGLREHGDGVTWLIYSWFAVGLVLFYSWVPFVALPIYVVLENMDTRLLEAAQDLGAGRLRTFFRVTLPLSLPGVIAAFVFVLIPTTGEFIAPLLVGGPDSSMFGNAIQSFFQETPNWNYGAVLAMWLIAVVLVLVLLFGRFLSTDLRESRATT